MLYEKFNKTQDIYPCLCLCLGFLQITLTLPFRLTTLQARQIFFTLDLTFIYICNNPNNPNGYPNAPNKCNPNAPNGYPNAPNKGNPNILN